MSDNPLHAAAWHIDPATCLGGREVTHAVPAKPALRYLAMPDGGRAQCRLYDDNEGRRTA